MSKDVTTILHLIAWIDQGGAESVLANLVRLAPPWERHHVHALISSPNFFQIDPARVTMGPGKRGRPQPGTIWRLRKTVAELRPNIIHAWMYHANLASAVAVPFRVPIIWSMHNDVLREETSKRATRIVNRLCAPLSYLVPQRIVYVCQSARETHERQGYAPGKGMVIANGIDLARFDPARFPPRRQPLGDGRAVTVTMVARYEPVKGHHFFIETLARHPARERIRLRLVGRGCDRAPALREHLARSGLLERTTLSDAVGDIERVYAESDILAVPSFSEALPLTVLEACAMGCIPCVARVGAMTELGLPDRFLFAPGDHADCAKALSAAIEAVGDAETGRLLRAPIARSHDVAIMVREYSELYARVAGGAGQEARCRNT